MTHGLRAWDPVAKKMHYMGHIPAPHVWQIGICSWNGKLSVGIPLPDGGYVKSSDVMHSIMAIDIKGNNIYESDIVRWIIDKEVEGEFIDGIIVYTISRCAYEFYSLDPTYGSRYTITPGTDLEVLGNIYEHLSLLPEHWPDTEQKIRDKSTAPK